MPEDFRKNICESCSGEYLKYSPPDTFHGKGRGPLRSLGHHNAYAENIKTMNDGRGSANIAVFDITKVESSLVDFSRFPSTLKNDFFVRANDTISCKEGDGSACYTSTVYQQDLLKPFDQPCNFGVIRITVEAFVPKSIAILGKATRNEGDTISIVPYTFHVNGKFCDFLWYSADSKLSTIDQVNTWYHSRNLSPQSEKDEVNEEDNFALFKALSSTLIAFHNEVRVKKRVDKFGKEYIPNEYTILRFIKWAIAILSCVLFLFHVEWFDLEFLFLIVEILLQCRDSFLETRGYKEEEGRAYSSIQTDSNHSITNPQDPNLDMNKRGITKRQVKGAKSS